MVDGVGNTYDDGGEGGAIGRPTVATCPDCGCTPQHWKSECRQCGCPDGPARKRERDLDTASGHIDSARNTSPGFY